MICGIVGKLGRGKTLMLSILAYITFKYGSFAVRKMLFPEIFDLSNNNLIYANYVLKFDFVPVLKEEDFIEMKTGSAFLDEFWIWADSRMSMSNKNKIVNHIAQTSRKRGIDIFYTAQTWGKIDKRIRDITDIIIAPHYNIMTGIIDYDVLEANDMYPTIIKQGTIYAVPFFGMYDTKEEIKDMKRSESSSLATKNRRRDSDDTKEEINDLDRSDKSADSNKEW